MKPYLLYLLKITIYNSTKSYCVMLPLQDHLKTVLLQTLTAVVLTPKQLEDADHNQMSAEVGGILHYLM